MPRATRRLLVPATLAALLMAVLQPSPAGASPPDYTSWVDLGIVYSAPSGDAYYPSVIYDADGFGTGSPLYKMWYSDGSGGVFVTTSSDGVTWSNPPTTVNGLDGDAHHVQVVYDANCFTSSCDSSDPKYKIWYWDGDQSLLYSIQAIRHATSSDGVAWDDDHVIAQDSAAKLVTGTWPDWNTGSYGPVDVLYQPGASNSDSDPWDYSYVMYFDGTDGSSEVTGLAYSHDGLEWTAYSSAPVLDKGGGNDWDCDDAVYGTVYQDANGYHFWYSGGGGDNGSGGCASGDPVHEGIGYASSSDGKTWAKDTGNPVFHISDDVAYRNERTYTPAVIKVGDGFLRMYYSAKGSSNGAKKIGLAVLSLSPLTFDGFFQPIDNDALNLGQAGQAIPVKWRITDANGVGVADPASFVSLTSFRINCSTSAYEDLDAIEIYAGSAGLIYQGDGNWQFNWKTPKTYAGQCRTMVLTLADGSTHTADFKFR